MATEDEMKSLQLPNCVKDPYTIYVLIKFESFRCALVKLTVLANFVNYGYVDVNILVTIEV